VHELFLFRYADIGPFEAFGEYPVLRALVAGVIEAGFAPRLLTSGVHFTDTADTVAQFEELQALGTKRIMLRLDNDSVQALSDEAAANFVIACGASGLDADIRFDMADSIPERFYEIVRLAEELRFYSQVFPRRIRPTRRVTLPEFIAAREDLRRKSCRVVATADGTVLLRTRDECSLEIEIGSLTATPLQRVLDIERIAPWLAHPSASTAS
jgi:hypothetical protein